MKIEQLDCVLIQRNMTNEKEVQIQTDEEISAVYVNGRRWQVIPHIEEEAKDYFSMKIGQTMQEGIRNVSAIFKNAINSQDTINAEEESILSDEEQKLPSELIEEKLNLYIGKRNIDLFTPKEAMEVVVKVFYETLDDLAKKNKWKV